MTTTGPPRRGSPWRVVRIAVAVALTAAILYRIDLRAALDALRGPNPAALAASVALVILDRTLMGWRWIALLGVVDPRHRPPLGPALRVFFVSTFLGTFLPGSIGGDAVRTVATARLGVPAASAAASVALDRLLGVVGLVLLAIVGLVTSPELAGDRVIVAALAFSLAVAGAGVTLIFSTRAAAAALRATRLLPGGRVRGLFADTIEAVRRHADHRGLIAAVLAASVAVQVLRVLEAWALGLALGVPATLSSYFALVPLILLVMLLPISVNGVGTSQAAFVWLFGKAGVAGAPAFALSVLFLALGVIGNLPGAFLYAFPGRSIGDRSTESRATGQPRR
jgi:uncharacterized protein (TIRG00374 family)